MFTPEHLTTEQSVFLESRMAETTSATTYHLQNEAAAEMFRVKEAAKRVTHQVADVLMKVKREYPEWNLPREIAQSRPA